MLQTLSAFTISVKKNLQGLSFTTAYKPFSKKEEKITELTYFLKLDLSNSSGVKDFALFTKQALDHGFMPIAGPIFRIPQIEQAKKGIVILQVVVRKIHKTKSASKKIIYIASPHRLVALKDAIVDFVEKRNGAWLYPFHSLPYEYFEGGGATRKETMDFCCKLIDICDELWVMGISDGTLLELESFLTKKTQKNLQKSLKMLVKVFDPQWKKILMQNGTYNQILKRHEKTLQQLQIIAPSSL